MTTGCQQTKKSGDNRLSADLANFYRAYLLIVQMVPLHCILLDFSLTVKAATLIFISGHGLAITSAKEGKSGFIYNLVNN